MDDSDERTDGDSGEWEVVRTVGTDEEARLIVGFLQGSDLPAEAESLIFHQEPVTFGHLGEVRVRVPAERAQEARRLLDRLDDQGLGDETDRAELEGEGRDEA
jgi:hypothetical protein